jgi:hypothetical protein
VGYLPFTSSLCMGNLGVNPLLRDLLRSFKLGKHLGVIPLNRCITHHYMYYTPISFFTVK